MSLDAPVDIAGIDGCKGGWIAVVKRRGQAPCCQIFPKFADTIANLATDAVVAVDMPIGLPARADGGGRGPEAIVRRLLGKRRSSVFSIPSRSAVYATSAAFTTLQQWHADHRAACVEARATSDPPRAVSIQAFAIFQKIREIDAILQGRPDLRERLIESHPEIAFWRLNDQSAMDLPKKIKGTVNPAGMDERRRLLARHGLDRDFLDRRPPRGAGEDDVLDACAMLLVAERYAKGVARPFPDPPVHDEHGIPIAIWA